jgi:hypothetical protein
MPSAAADALDGINGRIAEVFNDVVHQNASLAAELVRLRKVVGKEGNSSSAPCSPRPAASGVIR